MILFIFIFIASNQDFMIDYNLLGRKVSKLYPFLAKEMISMPELTDLKKIGELFVDYTSIQSFAITKQQQINQRLIFIGAIIKLYDPDAFDFKKNMKNGLRQKLVEVLNCKPSTISDSFKLVRNYMSIYPSFTNELNYIYEELKNGHNEEEKDTCHSSSR